MHRVGFSVWIILWCKDPGISSLLFFSHDYTVCPYPDESNGLLNYVFASVSNRNPSYISALTKTCYSVSQPITDPQVLIFQVWQRTRFLIKTFYILLAYISCNVTILCTAIFYFRNLIKLFEFWHCAKLAVNLPKPTKTESFQNISGLPTKYKI